MLFLGAGASIPSGAPSATQLATELDHELTDGAIGSENLADVCGICEMNVGRDRLVEAIRMRLSQVQPSGGLLAVPRFPWAAIYTTNYDTLVEFSYQRAGRSLLRVRSNYDYSVLHERAEGTPLFKLHGCLSEDLVDGSRARMVLTDLDYEEHEEFRTTLYSRLELDLQTKDILIVGYSLSDTRLREEILQAVRLRDTQGLPGTISVLAYEPDEARAALLEQRGLRIAFGSIDYLTHHLVEAIIDPGDQGEPADDLIPTHLVSSTIEVEHAIDLEPNPGRLFNGGPASYADIQAELTFERVLEERTRSDLMDQDTLVVALVGAEGTGKTTIARRVLHELHSRGYICWEHKQGFPLQRDGWQGIERRLREADRYGFLLVDDCGPHLRDINLLLEDLGSATSPRLKLLLTSPLAVWRTRVKSPVVFASGSIKSVSVLEEPDIANLVALAGSRPQIRRLVDQSFASLSAAEQRQRLRQRCRADMFVCLKNIFLSEGLDQIILQEYAGLEDGLQDIYRLVSAIEATGAQAHRQWVMRLTGLESSAIPGLLNTLEGVVDEFDMNANEGIFGWSTRHPVIAQTVTKYKYSEDEDRESLLESLVDSLNPTVYVEMRSLVELCSSDYGIGSLNDDASQLRLLRRLVRRVPQERVPRHRLVRKLIDIGAWEDADTELRMAREEIGLDSPLQRYQCLLLIRRAEDVAGLLLEDRIAILREARRLALKHVERYPDNRYAYRTHMEVAESLARVAGDSSELEVAKDLISSASDRLLDPELQRDMNDVAALIRRYES